MRITGALDRGALDRELDGAAVAVVSHRYEGTDFTVPSKLRQQDHLAARGAARKTP